MFYYWLWWQLEACEVYIPITQITIELSNYGYGYYRKWQESQKRRVDRIIDLIVQEADNRQGQDYVSRLHSVIMDISLEVFEVMKAYREQERHAERENKDSLRLDIGK